MSTGKSSEKKRRKKWNQESMQKAYHAIINKEMGYLKASKTFNVPKSTLESYVKNRSKTIDELIETKLGRKATFTPEMEKELVAYCLLMVNSFYGLRASDIRTLAFQLAMKNGISHQFVTDKGSAGKKWLKFFLKRNSSLSFRKPQATSANRVKGFTREKVNSFYNILESELCKIDNDPCRIYNVDETGVTIVQHKQTKVLSLKGQKQVGTLSSAERGALITLVTCMSAAGVFVPPLFIFPRVNMKNELKDGAPPGSAFACHKSGWIQGYIFTQWFKHFIAISKPNKEKPILLIFDGHFSHTRNMDVIDLARENGVIIVSLPPHTSGKMQPLDVAFMSPFKTYYAQAIETWLKSHPGRVITSYQVAGLVGQAYLRAATLEIAVNGFKKTGIWPFDRNVFKDHEFVQFENLEIVTGDDVNFEESVNENRPADTSNINAEPTMQQEETTAALTSDLPPSIMEPSTSSIGITLNEKRQGAEPCNSTFFITPADISPIPKFRKSMHTGRTGKAALISGSPYKNELESQLTKKKQAPTSKTKRKFETQKRCGEKPSKKKIKAKKKILQPSSSDSDDDEDFQLDSEDSGANDEDTDCLYCTNAFSNDVSGERWIRCIACYRWAHELCAGVDRGVVDFICVIHKCLTG